MAIEFDTRNYEAEHGRKPRGRGAWAVRINGKVHYLPGFITYNEARLLARRIAVEEKAEVVVVLP